MIQLCNCYHDKKDHHVIDDDGAFYTWCAYSEVGQCPCDAYTPMDNLQYLEHMNSIDEIEKLIEKKDS